MGEQIEKIPDMARIAQVLWNAGLENIPTDEEILGWCVEYVQNEIPLEGCTMYTYFRDGEEPRNGSVTFEVESQSDWEYAIECLKLLVKHGRLNLNGLTAVIVGLVTEKEVKFGDNIKANIRKLNKLKKIVPTSVVVRADGTLRLYLY
jgi:hypothetical protein